jgi:peroxiredoxin
VELSGPKHRAPREEQAVRADIVPGGTFPDYVLTDQTKKRRRLSDLQRNDPMILVLARGHYCPKDQQQHLQLAAFHSEIGVAYTRIVTISTDNIAVTREFRASVGATWTFLSDAGRKIQKISTSRSTPIPTTTRWCRTRSCSGPGW